MNPQHSAERAETRMLLAFVAARVLNQTERACIVAALIDSIGVTETAEDLGITRSGVWMAQRSGLRKMRTYLAKLGFHSTEQLLTTR